MSLDSEYLRFQIEMDSFRDFVVKEYYQLQAQRDAMAQEKEKQRDFSRRFGLMIDHFLREGCISNEDYRKFMLDDTGLFIPDVMPSGTYDNFPRRNETLKP